MPALRPPLLDDVSATEARRAETCGRGRIVSSAMCDYSILCRPDGEFDEDIDPDEDDDDFDTNGDDDEDDDEEDDEDEEEPETWQVN
jgi:hypothetical protein